MEIESENTFELRTHDSFGRGLFAMRDIENDKLIFEEKPLISITDATVTERRKNLIETGYEKNKVEKMDKNDHAVTWMHQISFHDECGDQLTITEELFAANEPNSTDAGFVKCYKVWHTNKYEDSKGDVHLFHWCSLLNHSCDPNCEMVYLPNGQVQLRSIKDIRVNDELTVSYFGPPFLEMQLIDRANYFARNYGIKCKCPKCTEEELL